MTVDQKHSVGFRGRGVSRLVGAILATAMLAVGGFAVPAGAETVDPALCTNFYPELCMGADGQIDITLSGIEGYAAAIAALDRHRAGDDTDGNGVPDSVEISLCEAAGCIAEWAANSTPNMQALSMELCPAELTKEGINMLTVPIPSGFDKKKLVSAFTLSDPEIGRASCRERV